MSQELDQYVWSSVEKYKIICRVTQNWSTSYLQDYIYQYEKFVMHNYQFFLELAKPKN